MKLPKLKKLITLEFYEDLIIAVLKFLIKRNPISPFYAFWKTLFVAKEWKSYKTYFKKFNKQFWTKHPLISAFGSFVFLILIISGTFFFVFNKGTNEAKADWWSNKWDYRKVMEIDHTKVDGDLTDFPVLVSFTDQDLVAKTQSDGDDIVFILFSDKSKLSHEIESYDNATGELVAWVKIPNLSSLVNTKIEMYYGNPTAISQQNAEDIWDAGYKGVWHYTDNGGVVGADDSTNNSNDGALVNVPTLVAGAVSKATKIYHTSNTDHYVTYGDDSSLHITGDTISFETWVKINDDDNGSKSLFTRTTNVGGFYLTIQGQTGIRFTKRAVVDIDLGSLPDDNDWHHLAVVASDSGVVSYVDGSVEGTNSNTGDILNDLSADASTRPHRYTVNDGFDLDELRVSSTTRSSEWISTSYTNQSNPALFFEVEREERRSGISWWNEGWNYRKIIEIDNTKVEDNLSDFPLLVSVTDLDLVSNAQADGDDIVFTTSIGKTKLAHEIESYNNTTGELIAWVKVPILSGEINTRIDMYYGNSTASSQQNSEGVWDDNYKLVQHLNESSGVRYDSTKNDNDATAVNGVANNTNGQINGADDFNLDLAEDDNLHIDDSSSLDLKDKITIEAWFNSDQLDTDQRIVQQQIDTSRGIFAMRVDSADGFEFIVYDTPGGSGEALYATTPTLSTSTWYHYVITFDDEANMAKIYVDGVERASDSNFTKELDPNDIAQHLEIGGVEGRLDRAFHGTIDEVRISNVIRSANWIATEHNNQNSPETFYSISNQQSSPGSPVAYWAFDEGHGTIAHDESSFGNDGKISGATWVSESNCVSGKCLKFDGDDDVVSLSSEISFDSNKTISFWMKGLDYPTSSWSMPVGKIDNDNYISVYNGNTIRVQDDTSSNKDWSVSFGEGEWVHVTLKREGSSWEIFENGISLGTNAASATLLIEHIGQGYQNDTYAFNGFIDEVKVFDYARTADQIKQEYNSGTAGAKTRTGSSVSFGGKSEKWLSDGLVGHWKMDEASWNGTSDEVIDSSGNENHGVRVGDANTTNGKYGSGGTFDGAGDYISVSPYPSPDAFSISMWIKATDSTKPDREGTFEWGLSGAGPYFMPTYFGATRLVLGSNNYRHWLNAGDIIYDAEWHHVIVTVPGNGQEDINSAELYVDGSLMAPSSTTSSGTQVSKTLFRIGQGDGYNFDGEIDEVRFYNRALSKSEAQKLYHATPAPVLDLKLDEKEGSTAYDQSGYGNNATLYNSPTWTRGKFGSGVHFQDTTIDYLETPKSPSLNFSKAAGLTLESWVYLETADDNHSIMSGWDGDENMSGSSYWVVDNLNSQSYKIRNMIPGGVERSIFTTWDTNRWYFLSYTYDGAKETLYRDGKVLGRWDQTGNIEYEDEVGVMIGTAIQRTRDFDGKLDGVKIYNYARSAEQINADMRDGSDVSGLPYLHLDLNEGYGSTAYNKTRDNSNATLISGTGGSNTTTSAMWRKDGRSGGAIDFDGTDDYLQINSFDGLNGATNATISFWAMQDVNQTSRYAVWGNENVLIEFGDGYNIPGTTNLRLRWNLIDDWKNSHTAVGVLDTDTWHHWVFSFDTGETKIYKDGDVVYTGSDTQSHIRKTSPNYTIGYRSGSGIFNGKIDEFKVHTYTLSGEDVKREFATSGRAMQMGGENRTATSGSTTKSGENAKYCVPGDTTNCDAPVLELDFDEKTGTTVYDKSGNGNDGTMMNMEADSDWVRGKYGSALDFDASNDYINLGNQAEFNITEAITVSMWLTYRPKSVYSGWKSPLSKGYDKSYAFKGMGSGVGWRLQLVNNGNNYIGGPSLQEGRWYNVVGTYDGQIMKYYMNGVEVNSLAVTDTIKTTTDPLTIGYDNYYQDYYNGSIDQVRIYDYARTPAQIAWDFNKGKPIAHWKFDEGISITVHDESGNGNDGTLTNMDQDTDWVDGKVGKTLDFDGVNDFVELGSIDSSNPLSLNGSEGTISAWIYKRSGGDSFQRIIDKSNDSSGAGGYGVWIDDRKIGISVGGSSWDTDDIMAIDYDTWHHVVVIIGSTSCTAFVDGVEKSGSFYQGSAELPPSTTTNARIGTWNHDTSREWGGMLDDLRVYNYSLNEAQIKNVYNDGAALRFK